MSGTDLDKIQQQILITLLINNGDVLKDISVLKANVTRQDLKKGVTSRLFRDYLLSNGLAHSFYQGFLWIMPVNGEQIGSEDIKNTVMGYFTKRLEVELAEIKNFNDEYFWMHVGLVLFRDALRYTLSDKFRDNGNMILRGLNIYDKKQIVQSDMSIYTIAGISLERVYLVNTINIGLSPLVVYDVYSYDHQRVKDKYERQRYITKAAQCSFLEHLRRLNSIMDKIFPLTINFSNKKLIFRQRFHEVYEKTKIEEKEKKRQMGLEKWL